MHLAQEKYSLFQEDLYRREIFMDSGIRFPEHIFYEDNAISDATELDFEDFKLSVKIEKA